MSELDDQIAEVADFFAGRFVGETDVLFADELDRAALDFSLESLHAVDSWLNVLYENQVSPDHEDVGETMIWSGAYVGEVIRRHAKRRYSWMRHEDYMATQPETIQEVFSYTFGTQFILVHEGGMTLPINKIVRWLDEGPENNVHFYASAECDRE